MAKEFFGFFDSISDDEREYDAEEFAHILRASMRNGITSHAENGLRVVQDGSSLRTKVTPGGCVINGYLYVLSDDGGEWMNFEHVAAVGSQRWDRIVARLDKRVDARRISLKLLVGVSGQDAPALTRNDYVYEISLAKVCVRPGATAISATDIVDERMDENLCGAAVPVWLTGDKLGQQFTVESITNAEIDAMMNA
ncbi:MAG: hypothetical protein J6K72_06810 [Clostridia bacterium]|nr:hypothetical protein [Clostridia bacterium]